MVQLISKNKLLSITLIILFAFLSNLYLISGVNVHPNQLATDFWSQAIDDISNQAISIKEHRQDYSLSYRLFRFNSLCIKLFQFDHDTIRVIITQVPDILRKIGLFFLIFYQLSRTSGEKSDPYGVNRKIRIINTIGGKQCFI